MKSLRTLKSWLLPVLSGPSSTTDSSCYKLCKYLKETCFQEIDNLVSWALSKSVIWQLIFGKPTFGKLIFNNWSASDEVK